MKFELLDPADQLVSMMNRIYSAGLTTTSGGNLSILDENGNIWITPSGVDKGALTREDIMRVSTDGTVSGRHRPSVELPFHAEIYRRRPDIRAVLHAHSPALVAFSVVHKLPDVNLVASARNICGAVAMAAYAVPGSKELGNNIAAEFEKGADVVLLENHGLCVGAGNLSICYERFEALESMAKLEVNARRLGGKIRSLNEVETDLANAAKNTEMDDFVPSRHTEGEDSARREMISIIRRAYRQGLFDCTQGTFSVRLDNGAFLITPESLDSSSVDESDLVLVRTGMKESGKIPSHSVLLHAEIFRNHPEIGAIIGANPPHAMAFAVTDAEFDPRTIPESYFVLRDIKKIPFGATPEDISDTLSTKVPALICKNDQIIATGATLLKAFDCLEVADATARSILLAREIGSIVRFSGAELRDIDIAFGI